MPSVEEALKISQDFLEFAKEVRANNVIKEQQEEEKTVLKVKVNCQFVRIFSNTHTHIEYTFPHLHIWHALAHVHCASVQICKTRNPASRASKRARLVAMYIAVAIRPRVLLIQ